MTLRTSSPRAKPRWLAAAVVVGLLMVVSAGLSYAAVFGDQTDPTFVFELDRNPQDDSASGSDPGDVADDWATLYNAGLDNLVPTSGALDAILTHDEANIDETYFTGGSSKDDIDIDTVAGTPGSGGWLRDKTSSAQPKADIQHAFATTYIVDHDNNPATPGKTTVYFGLDRYSNDGATFAGFWFLQGDVTLNPTTANNGVGEINGKHQKGDLLIITDFTQGGPVVNFAVYVWIGPGGTPYPQYDQTIINGVFQKAYQGTDCTLSTTTGIACSTVNNAVVDSLWSFAPAKQVGDPGEYQPGLFLEGGINITDAFPNTTAPCFSSFVAETRASFSVDSTLSDFTLGGFNTCGSVKALKYHDLNANGSRDADGVDNIAGNSDDEVPLSGWTIFIDTDGDEALDASETSFVTDSNGEANFGSALPAGSYSFCEVLKASWLNSDPTGTTLCESVTVGAGGSTTIDFGNYQNVTQKVLKYHDKNADGSRDADGVDNIAGNSDDEVLLSGWEFYIENGANEIWDSGVDSAKQSTVAGETSFTLTPGASYKICEVLQANWINSDPSGTTICESTGTVVSGTGLTDMYFGNYQEYRLIVLTCNEASGLLVESTVDLDGAGTSYSEKTSIGTPPALSGKTTAELQAYLCNLGGAQYDDLLPQTFTSIKVILPKAS